jgi:hypothetical protein
VVAFCNLNKYDFNFAGENVNNFTEDGTVNRSNSNFTANDYVTKTNQYLQSNLIKKFVNDLYQLYYMSNYLDQMLLSCTFQGKNCSFDDFMFHYDYVYGLCWRFNMGRDVYGNITSIKTSGQAGFANGLQLELYAGLAQMQEKFVMKRGFRVLVFNRTNVYPIPGDIGIDVSTGQETSIGITRTFTNHLPAPFSNCLQSDITQIDWNQNDALKFMYDNFVTGQYYWTANAWEYAGDWTWNWTVSYSQSICVKLCFQKYLFQKCGNISFCKTKVIFLYLFEKVQTVLKVERQLDK